MRNPLLFLCLFLSACGGADLVPQIRTSSYPPSDAEVVKVRGKTGGELRYPMAGEPSTFNYLAAADARTRLVAYLTTATLLQLDARQQEVVGGICEAVERSSDGMTVRLKLREGVLFSDGTLFTADDIVFTFREIYDQNSNNALKESLLVSGKPLEVERIDDYEVEVRFPEPYAAAEYILATVPIFPRHLLDDAGRKIEECWTLGTPPEQMSGLGPFVIEAHEPGMRTVLRYNPHYWRIDSDGTQLPYLDRIILEYIPDKNNQLLRLKAGELDLLDSLLRPEDLRYLERDIEIETQDIGPSSNLAFYWFNLSAGQGPLELGKQRWFSQAKFRQAINCVVNRKSIIDAVYLGMATEAVSLVPSSNRKWYMDDLVRCDNNQDSARRLLGEAGFSWRFETGREVLVDEQGEVVKFELLTPSDDILGKISAILRQDMESLGIDLSIRQEEFRSVISRIMTTRDYDTALMFLDFPIEPVDLVNVLLSSGSMHMWNPRQVAPGTGWEGRIDKLMVEQRRALDYDTRYELFQEVQRLLAEQRPFIPLVNRNSLLAKRRGLVNLKPATIFPFSLWNVWEICWAN